MEGPEVGEIYKGVRVLETYPIGANRDILLVLSVGTIVDFTGDAIVNAANQTCLGGGGVDGAINLAAGPTLKAARRELPEIESGIRCRTGDAVVTIPGLLKTKFIIHAVGPIFQKSQDYAAQTNELSSAYRNALTKGEENNCESVAFSILSSGVYRGHRSMEDVVKIGLQAIINFFANRETTIKEVFVVGYTKPAVAALKKEAKKIINPGCSCVTC